MSSTIYTLLFLYLLKLSVAWDYYAGVYNNITDINNELRIFYECTKQFHPNITVIVEKDNMVSVGFQLNEDQINNSTLDRLRDCYRSTMLQFTFLSNISMIDDVDIIDTANYVGEDLVLSLDQPTLIGWYDHIRGGAMMQPLRLVK